MGKRILNVINSMNPITGGPCEGIRNLIPELKHHGIIADVVTLDNPDEVFLKNDHFKIFALGLSWTAWKYNSKLLHWLIENLQNYDVVIIRGLWLYHGYAVYRAIQILKKKISFSLPKVYIMPHGMLDPWFQKESSRKLKSLRNIIYWHLIEKKIINNSQGVLFTCNGELELAGKTFKDYKPKSELNIGYGINPPPSFNDNMIQSFLKKCPEIINKPFFLFLGRIDKKKGIDLLLYAYNDLLILGYSIPFLVIAGPGLDSDFGKNLSCYVKNSYLLSQKVFFTGMLSGDAKWGAFYSCDAFILPSHQENFGIAVVEALACEKAVLITNRINISHDINKACAGIIESDTLDGVKYLIKRWIVMSSSDKQRMMKHSKDLFNTKFTIKAAVSNMITKLSID